MSGVLVAAVERFVEEDDVSLLAEEPQSPVPNHSRPVSSSYGDQMELLLMLCSSSGSL